MGRVAKRRRPAALLIGLALALLALALATGACGGGDDASDTAETGDTDTTTTDRQGDRRSDARIFSWQSSDGVEIVAELHRGGEEWVLMGHQFTGSRRDWDQMVEGFVERGYTVLIWDFRCHGESGCNTLNDSKREATKDIWREWVAALDYAVDSGARVIHAGGASMGGTSLIQVAADRDEVATIFAISSPNRFQGLDALENYDRVTVPKLFIAGAGDMFAPEFSQRYFDRATGPARLNILETDLHGNTLAQDPEWGPIVQAMLYAFVADSQSYVAAGDVNNLSGDSAAASQDDEDTPPAPSDDAEPDDEQATAQAADDASPAEEGQAPLPGLSGAPPSGYVIALLAPGRLGDQLVVVDPFARDDFLFTREFDGDVSDFAWAPTGSSIVVGQPDQLVLIDLAANPPPEIIIPTASFLPQGLAPDFFEMNLSDDGFILSFAVLPEGIAQAPSTPALLNLLGPTLLAPYAGELSDSPGLAGLFSPDDRLLLSREVGGLVVLQAGTLEVAERLPAPELPGTSDACVSSLCVQIIYNTVFPDEYGWLDNAIAGVVWARYSNVLFLRLPGDPALSEWLTLPGRPVDVAVSPNSRIIAWISSGPPEGTNALFLSDLDSGTSTLLLQDDDLFFFDMDWSPDSRFIAFSSLVRGDTSTVGVIVVDTQSGDVTLVGPGCCAQWSPLIFPS